MSCSYGDSFRLTVFGQSHADGIGVVIDGIPAGADVTVEPDRRAAIHLALARAAQGDTVVVCGKGHETTQTVGTRVLPFDDRIVCAEY